MDAATMSVLSISAVPFRLWNKETHGATSTISAPVHLNFSELERGASSAFQEIVHWAPVSLLQMRTFHLWRLYQN